MFKLLLILVPLISFQVNSEELKKFKIEGFGLGENLIDFMSENQIKSFYKPEYSELAKDKKYVFIEFSEKKFKIYDNITVAVSNDFDISKYLPKDKKKFQIISIDGGEFLDIEVCLKKKLSIEKEFDSGFKFKSKEKKIEPHPGDKSDKSLVHLTDYTFQNGDRLSLSCYDWSEDITSLKGWRDHLSVSLMSKLYIDWYGY